MKENKLIIEVNNGGKLEVELKDNKLIFTSKDDKGTINRVDSILEGEVVLLYDYILYRKDNNKELF